MNNTTISKRQTEESCLSLVESTSDSMYLVDENCRYLFINSQHLLRMGMPSADIVGKSYGEFHSPEQSEIFVEKVKQVFKTGKSVQQEHHSRRDDRYFLRTFSPIKEVGPDGKIIRVAVVSKDITERKSAENRIDEALHFNQTILSASPVAILTYNSSGQCVSANEAASKITGGTIEGLLAQNFRQLESWKKAGMIDPAENALTTGQVQVLETRIVTTFGKDSWFDCRFTPFYYEGELHLLLLVSDITKQKRAQEELRQAEERYHSIFDNAQVGIYRTTPAGRFITVNRAMADMLGYDSPEELIASITDIAHQLYVNPRDRTKLRRMVGEHGSVTGFETQFYRKDGNRVWVSINIRAVRHTNGRILYYDGINEDISIRKQAEDERKQNFERLRRALRTTIEAVAMTVETRDPYTAGHQRRVSDLARAIATEMGLSRERIDGIRMVGTIHDIGKLCVPSEILSNPTKLTNIEYSLIKKHSRKGYEILKNVESPWPLAEIVYQHHERMNGSGYPRNLKGDDILMEARILAVADVVESMASHRPYRPSFGIDAALKEIENNKGTLYDTGVVDVCLRIFMEKGYQLK